MDSFNFKKTIYLINYIYLIKLSQFLQKLFIFYSRLPRQIPNLSFTRVCWSNWCPTSQIIQVKYTKSSSRAIKVILSICSPKSTLSGRSKKHERPTRHLLALRRKMERCLERFKASSDRMVAIGKVQIFLDMAT